MVRAQIDRLTPWSANDAAFGWSEPKEAGADRMVVTVVATARAMVQPVIDALTGAGADSVSVVTAAPDAAPIQVFDRAKGVIVRTGARRARGRAARRGFVMSAAQPRSTGSSGERAGTRTRRISERRAASRAGRETGTQVTTPLRALERRKFQTPSSVVLLDVLSQILPDHTYVTELRIEGDKMRVIGVTRDAPALIRLLEQSPHFTRATFLAPTTRAPSDPGERFHIEAQIEPVFALRS